MSCLDCGGGALTVALDLGDAPVVGFPSEDVAPLRLCRCRDCGLVQLDHYVPVGRLYRQAWYRSGVSETMRAELESVRATAAGWVPDAKSVLDIGANDGTLLALFDPAWRRAGIDAAMMAPSFDVEWMTGTWPHARLGGRFDVITSIAMWNHARERGRFLDGIRESLTETGIWIVQWQDLAEMLWSTAFDNICHEHVTYDSLTSFEAAVNARGLMVVDVETRAINGGSLRVIVRRAGAVANDFVRRQREREAFLGSRLTMFRETVTRRIAEIRQAVAYVDGPVDLYGASTKGLTLLYACGLTSREIRQAIERDPAKIGRTVGATGIPIVSEADGRRDPAAAWLVPIWQFKDAIIQREADYLARGGRLIVPLPVVETIARAQVAA